MENWKDTLKLDDEGDLVTNYFSKVFNTAIPIRLMDTSDKAHPQQTQIINQLVANESEWLEKALKAIIDYYKEAYADYRSGWESGGADEETIEKYLPREINKEKLFALIKPAEIYIHPEENCTPGKFGFGLECEWDIEHGVGVYFNNWDVVDTGGVDVAFGY